MCISLMAFEILDCFARNVRKTKLPWEAVCVENMLNVIAFIRFHVYRKNKFRVSRDGFLESFWVLNRLSLSVCFLLLFISTVPSLPSCLPCFAALWFLSASSLSCSSSSSHLSAILLYCCCTLAFESHLLAAAFVILTRGPVCAFR